MTRRIIWLGAAALLLATPALAGTPPAVEWTRTFGGLQDADGRWGEQTNDGGFVVCGGTDTVMGLPHFYLVKTDSLGARQWEKVYTTTTGDAYFVTETSDSGFILAGESDMKALLVKTDASGAFQWSCDVGADAMGAAYSAQQTTDGGYVVGCRLAGVLPGLGYTRGMGLVKTDTAGTVLWRKVLAEDDYGDQEALVRGIQTCDGSYVVAGRKEPLGLRLAKVSSSGATLWERTYPEQHVGDGRSVQQTADGGYVVAGVGAGQHPAPSYSGDIYLLKTDSAGNLSWIRRYGGADMEEGHSVRQTSDGGYILAGTTRPDGRPDYDGYVVRTDTLGNLLWSKTIGVAGRHDEARCALQASDGGFVITGMGLYSPQSDSVFMFLQKLAPETQ